MRLSGAGASSVLADLAADAEVGGQLVHLTGAAPRPARFADPSQPLAAGVAERLAARRIDRLWAHQAAAIDALRRREHVVLATGTASGKSLCFQAPIVESVLEGRRETALLLFPTKALAHDQLRSLRSWLVPGLKAVTYDGDTPREDRAWARRNANVVLTNPEMLHAGMLPFHENWATFFMRLRLVVVDELHTLRGIFGSHAALLLRRLRRICAHYGSDPTFCFASATIGNPAELATELSGLPVTAVADDGSPRGERVVALWDRTAGRHPGEVPSANAETGLLLARLVGAGLKTIAFSSSRKGAEVVAQHALRRLGPAGRGAVAVYRGGLLAEERRALERSLSTGEVGGVSATNALELGIDVAGLDAVVLNGFPGTLASFWQQAGRAGRAQQASLVVLVSGDDQLDRWYFANPGEITARPLEPAIVNPANPFVLRPHVACAAHELPLAPDDMLCSGPLGEEVEEGARVLVHADALVPRSGRLHWARPDLPARGVGLRSGSWAEVDLVEGASGRLVGTVDASRAPFVAHPGAVYLHQGRQYRVEELDLDGCFAVLDLTEADEYTQARHDIDISIAREATSRPLGAATVHLGAVEVTTTTTAYQRRHLSTGKVIETVPLDLPPRCLPTRACWWTVPAGLLGALELPRVLGAVHAAEHAMIGMLPLFAICDRWDVGGVSMAAHPHSGQPTIFIYDGYPGGAGIAELAYEAAERLVAVALDVIEACSCPSGCPSCVQSPKCGNWNEFLDKEAAALLLRGVLLGDADYCASR